jgi:hypothetical protein
MYMMLLVLLVILLFGSLPGWPYMEPYGMGYYPGLAFVVLILLVIFFLRKA